MKNARESKVVKKVVFISIELCVIKDSKCVHFEERAFAIAAETDVECARIVVADSARLSRSRGRNARNTSRIKKADHSTRDQLC